MTDVKTDAQEPVWTHGYNSCLHVAISALNYLSSHERPAGGQQAYNAEHLLQIADEIKRTIAHNVKAAAAHAQRSDVLTSDEEVDRIAKWLHDETAHPDSYPSHTWPETDRDDGQREGGFVKIVPQHAQAYFRDIARRLLTQVRPSSPVPSAKGE